MLFLNDIKIILAAYEPQLLEQTPRSAAVMLLLLQDDKNNLEIVITERAATLPTYAGHYSLPGGMHDLEDKDLLITAKRELHEELNIPIEAYEIIGQLDDFHDRYKNLVRPFVSVMPKQTFLEAHQISLAEINSVFYFPITQLHTFKDNPDLYKITNRRPSYSYSFSEVFIWGLTAGILVRFSQLLDNIKK